MDNKKTILVLASNPKNTTQLRLSEEIREIKKTLLRSRNRDNYEVKTEEALRIDDLRFSLLQEDDIYIVHFCGHGNSDGIALEDDRGEKVLVKSEAIAELFELFKSKVKCVILNACYSEAQAIAINTQIDFVIGMDKAIGDKAAIEFSKGFYDGIGAGKSIQDSFKLGTSAINLKDISEHKTPQLLEKKRNFDILIVDDEDSWREIISETFMDIYTFDFAESFHQAKTKILENNYKIICTNWSIKGEERNSGVSPFAGKKLISLLQNKLPNIPVILITGELVGSIGRLQKRFKNIRDVINKGANPRFVEDLEETVEIHMDE